MTLTSRTAAVVSILAAAALFAGCSSSPGADAPTSAPVKTDDAVVDDSADMAGALLDDGRMFAVVTWGSSTCVPIVDEVSAEGQTVTVTLIDNEAADAACTADMAPRASIGGLPEGVDPTKEITLLVTHGDVEDEVDLDGDAAFTGVPGTSTDYAPSAGWFDDGALVLLTWGSSGCLPVVEGLEGAGSAGTVTFVTDDTKACTMDMAPRATMLSFAADEVDDDDFTLTLVGDNLDGTVLVRG